MSTESPVLQELQQKFGPESFVVQETRDGMPTVWVDKDRIPAVLGFLKREIAQPYAMLYDLTAMDERLRTHRDGLPKGEFTVIWHLLSFGRNTDIRIKAAVSEAKPAVPSVTSLWPNASWYEREVWDMFGIKFEGHPNLRRILMPNTWQGHPLRKDHPARATEMGIYQQDQAKIDREQDAMQFKPEEWGMDKVTHDNDFIFLNLGPQHPGTHGVLRVVLQLDGEVVNDAIADIGYHHRGAEKMGERQTWHTFIPYTDRIDYLGGVMNNFAYCLAVEKLAGITVPPRAQVVRIMMSELFRIASHLVWWSTFAQDIGQMSPVFYMFNDRERIFGIVEAICGGRMHPSWFRIGGVAQDLPQGWDKLVSDFIEYFEPRLPEYEKIVMKNKVFQARTKGIGAFSLEEAIDWGATGPALRACGLEWDFRKKRPYGGYEQFEFDIPTATKGDCFDRAVVRVQEIYQSVRIVKQCLANMPAGPYKSFDARTTPPMKERTMHDIETLINHFVNVAWGPVIPAGEAFMGIEATKGNNGYYLVSDGGTIPYRVRIRTPSFAHIQMLPLMSRGWSVADVLAIIGSIDFVLADIDR